jgi:hypothetical protein
MCTKGTEGDGSSARDRAQSPEHDYIDWSDQVVVSMSVSVECRSIR